MEATQGHRLQSRAMQVSYNISTWTARKYDKEVSKEVDDAHATEREAGRYNKILIDLTALKEMNRHAGGTRQYIIDNSASWLSKGTRIITPEIYFEFTKEIRERKEKFWDLYYEFEPKYPDLRAAAEFELKGMFDIDDYPHPELLKLKFGYEITITPIPTLDLLKDLRTGLGDDEVKRIEAETEERMSSMFNKGVIELYDRLDKVVGNVVKRLSVADDKLRIHKTLLPNVVSMVELAGKLNYTGDPELERIRRKMEQTLVTYDTDDVKKLKNVRDAAIIDARDVRKDIAAAKKVLNQPKTAAARVDDVAKQMSFYM